MYTYIVVRKPGGRTRGTRQTSGQMAKLVVSRHSFSPRNQLNPAFSSLFQALSWTGEKFDTFFDKILKRKPSRFLVQRGGGDFIPKIFKIFDNFAK